VLAVVASRTGGEAYPGHTIYCSGWVADDKIGIDAYTWTADISCDNGNADIMSLGVWRERAQFGTTIIDWDVDPVFPVLTDLKFNEDFFGE